MKFLSYIIALAFSQIVFSQTEFDESKTKIASVLEKYFDLEREAIHLHVNKTTFLTNESIWYQGYIVNRKTNKPFFTSNVFVLLYDEKGNKLSEKLAFANDGSFSGKIDLNGEFHSGNYYIQVYTNWMNNFSENESAIQKINIINPIEGAKNYKKVNPNSLELKITPEGGNLVSGITNSIGIQIKDCRGNAPENCEATLQNSSGKILNTTKLNPFGYGKFEFLHLNENYKVVVNTENNIIEKHLPIANATGFTMKVNNYNIAGKTVVNINTNSETLKKSATKKFYLVIHQDQKHSINDINIDASSLQQTFTIPSSELSSGINTIRIIDSDLKEYAARLIYIYPKIEKAITLLKSNPGNAQVNLIGHSKYPNTILSSSFLPEKSIAWEDNNNIFAGITINPYLTESLPHANYYFSNPNRIKSFELDLALLNQPSEKYVWNHMCVTKPAINYSFDIGLVLKGKIDPGIKDKTYLKVKLMSYKNLMLLNSDVTADGEYNFEHILLPDSTATEITLLKLPNFEAVGSKLTPQVLNRNKPFYKGFKIEIPEHCDDNLETLDLDFLEFMNQKIIRLNEVEVEIIPKKRLLYENLLGNANLSAYKIEGALENQKLLNFIEFNGFTVINKVGEVVIYSSSQPNSLNAGRSTPAIFIDGKQIFSFIEVELLQMSNIDEIFLSPHAIVPGLGNYQGIIKIYTKRIRPYQYQNTKTKNPNEFYISQGFSRYVNFKNADYQMIGNNGFTYLGALDWSPRMLTDKEGSFSIELTDYNHQKGKNIIQGMTNDGILFQEEAIIELR